MIVYGNINEKYKSAADEKAFPELKKNITLDQYQMFKGEAEYNNIVNAVQAVVDEMSHCRPEEIEIEQKAESDRPKALDFYIHSEHLKKMDPFIQSVASKPFKEISLLRLKALKESIEKCVDQIFIVPLSGKEACLAELTKVIKRKSAHSNPTFYPPVPVSTSSSSIADSGKKLKMTLR